MNILLLLAGAYVLYESGLLSFLGISPGASLPTGSVQNTSAPSPSNPASPSPAVDTRGLLLASVQKAIASGAIAAKDFSGSANSPLMSGWLWNWYYSQIRGRDAQSAGWPAGNISIDEWWAPVSAAGFSGFAPSSTKAPIPGNRRIPEPKNCGVPVPGMGRWIY